MGSGAEGVGGFLNRENFLLLWFGLMLMGVLHSQEKSLDSLARTATDPTATIWQLQLEDFWNPVFSQDDFSSNQFRVRAVIPLAGKNPGSWDHLLRITTRTRNTNQASFGLGDTQIFDLLIPRRYEWGALGVGPLVSIPTATERAYGSGKLSLGMAMGLSFNNPGMGPWQMDFLVEYLSSISGDSSREAVSEFSFQPSITYHLNNGFYIETEPVVQYSFQTSQLIIPANLRFGKVFRIGEHRYNTYIEPETTLYSDQDIALVLGVRFGFRFLFRE